MTALPALLLIHRFPSKLKGAVSVNEAFLKKNNGDERNSFVSAGTDVFTFKRLFRY